jgi:hypothetical protein
VAVTGVSADPIAGKDLAEKWCVECHGIRADRLSPNLAAPTFPELAAEPSITEYSLRALLTADCQFPAYQSRASGRFSARGPNVPTPPAGQAG